MPKIMIVILRFFNRLTRENRGITTTNKYMDHFVSEYFLSSFKSRIGIKIRHFAIKNIQHS